MKYLVLSYKLVYPSDTPAPSTKEFKTYEKAKPFFELECDDPNNTHVQLMDVIEEKPNVKIPK